MWATEAWIEIEAGAGEVFGIWTNFEARSGWDDHDEWVRVQGPLAVGPAIRLKTRGAPATTVRISELEPGRRIVTEGRVPLGRLRFVFDVADRAAGGVVATYRQELTGPASPLMARTFGPRIAADAPITMDRLARQVVALGAATR